jgi:hypothetical protein
MFADLRGPDVRSFLIFFNLPVHCVRDIFAYIDWKQGFGRNELRKHTQGKVAVEEAKIGCLRQ